MAFPGSGFILLIMLITDFVFKYNQHSGQLINLSVDAAAFINIGGLTWLFYPTSIGQCAVR
jgi:hypothetical protein